MKLMDIKCGSGFYNWTEYREKATRAEVWTENGTRIDGANRGDRHDNGITVYRPDSIPRKIKNKIINKLYIIVDTEDRQTITAINAIYGHYPETVNQWHEIQHAGGPTT